MRFLARSLIIIYILLCAAPSFGAAYTKYVANAPTGSDSNSGDSGSPWETVARVNTFLNTLAATDTATVYFNKGDTFTFTSPLLYGVTFDSDADQVDLVFDAYGSGAAPILNNNCGSYNLTNIQLAGETDVDSITIQNIKLTRNDSNDSIASIWIDDFEGNVVIDNVEIDGNGSGSAAMASGYACLMLRNIGGDITITNSTIYNCMQIYNNPSTGYDYHGIFLRGQIPAGKSSGTITIGGSAENGNTVYQTNGDTIQVMGIQTTTTISYNYLYQFGENAMDIKASYPIVFEYNKVDRMFFGRGGTGSINPDVTFVRESLFTNALSKNAEIRYNYFTNSNYPAWRVANHSTTGGDESYIHHNYVENHAVGFYCNSNFIGTIHNNVIELDRDFGYVSSQSLEAGIYFGSSANLGSGTAIYNNTFYIHNPKGTYIADGVHQDAGTATYKNNIFYLDVDDLNAYPFECDGGTPTIAYNNYHNPNNANTVDGCSLSVDANSTTTDPLIVANFPELASTSPCLNDGDSSVGATYKDALFWPGSVWTPAASIDVWTYDQDDAGTGWEMGAVAYVLGGAPTINDPSPGQTNWDVVTPGTMNTDDNTPGILYGVDWKVVLPESDCTSATAQGTQSLCDTSDVDGNPSHQYAGLSAGMSYKLCVRGYVDVDAGTDCDLVEATAWATQLFSTGAGSPVAYGSTMSTSITNCPDASHPCGAILGTTPADCGGVACGATMAE